MSNNSDTDSSQSDYSNTETTNTQTEQTEDDVEVTKEFQERVIKFIKLDDMMREKQKEIKELRSQRKICEDYILKSLDKMDEKVIDITNGRLRKNKAKTKSTLTNDMIKTAILEEVGDPKKVEKIMASMEERRPKVTHTNLKRTKVGGD